MTDDERRELPTVAIAIVNWNAGLQLRDCLTSIVAANWTRVRLRSVVVVDNASTDGSLDELADVALAVEVIRNSQNHGFGAACNQAARSLDADYVLFLNPDTRVEPEAVARAVGCLEEPAHRDVGIVGGRLVQKSGEIARGCARFPTPWTCLTRLLGFDRALASWGLSYPMTEWDHAQSREVDHVMGAFYMVRRTVFEALGGFDERFFMYLEDVDFSRRARKAGWRCFYNAEAGAYHRGGGTSEQVKDARLFYSLHSRVLYAQKHFSRAGLLTIAICTLFAEPVIRLVACTARGSMSGVRDTISAYAMLWRTTLGFAVAPRESAPPTRERSS